MHIAFCHIYIWLLYISPIYIIARHHAAGTGNTKLNGAVKILKGFSPVGKHPRKRGSYIFWGKLCRWRVLEYCRNMESAPKPAFPSKSGKTGKVRKEILFWNTVQWPKWSEDQYTRGEDMSDLMTGKKSLWVACPSLKALLKRYFLYESCCNHHTHSKVVPHNYLWCPLILFHTFWYKILLTLSYDTTCFTWILISVSCLPTTPQLEEYEFPMEEVYFHLIVYPNYLEQYMAQVGIQ